MKKITVTLICLIIFFCKTVNLSAFVCSNCSQEVMDVIRHAQSIAEFIIQTKKLIEQTEMEIKNLEQLAEILKDRPLDFLKELALRTNRLDTYRADINLLIQIFNEIYPEQSTFAELANADQSEIDAANAIYQEHYDRWSAEIDKAVQATFQLTGGQLKDLEESGELQSYIHSLLQTPEGHMQAMQAGNELAALQINESRQLREMIATKAQADALTSMKAEKENEMNQELWRKATSTEKLENRMRNDEPIRFQ